MCLAGPQLLRPRFDWEFSRKEARQSAVVPASSWLAPKQPLKHVHVRGACSGALVRLLRSKKHAGAPLRDKARTARGAQKSAHKSEGTSGRSRVVRASCWTMGAPRCAQEDAPLESDPPSESRVTCSTNARTVSGGGSRTVSFPVASPRTARQASCSGASARRASSSGPLSPTSALGGAASLLRYCSESRPSVSR